MLYKPQIIIFYENDEFLDKILARSPFAYNTYISKKQSTKETLIDFEYYRVQAFKRDNTNFNFARGHKPSKIIMEKSLYEKLDKEIICVLQGSLCINGILGSYRIETIE